MKKVFLGLWLCLLASSVLARGGGGCFEAGTLIDTPTGAVPIECLHVGDRVTGGRVEALTRVEPTEYLELPGNVHVTPKHPFQIAPGIFRTAELAFPDAKRFVADRPAFNLLVSPSGTFFAGGYLVHNKGCFLPDTPIVKANGSRVAISELKVGDRLLAFTGEGAVVETSIRDILTHNVDEFLIVRTDRVELRVTVEHPFYVGAGTFKTLESLKPGDVIYAYDGVGLRAQAIRSIDRVGQPVRVYNLQTDAPNTYFANGIAVHNKGGGGGGCFPAGTPVHTPRGPVAIENLRPGDIVANGQGGVTPIVATYITRSPVLTLTTDHGTLRTTAEHPILCRDGQFRLVGDLSRGDQLPGATVQACLTGSEEIVYNLRVGWPHTFVAGGFVVHNKGGGGGFHGGGYRGRSGGSGRPMTPGERRMFFTIVGGIVVIVILVNVTAKRRVVDEDLDFCYRTAAIEPKAIKTRKLLEFIARTDTNFTEEKLRQRATETFIKLQEWWQAREYGPMQPLLMPDLYREHCSQLAGLKRNHEINIIEGVRVGRVDIVNVRYPRKVEQHEFTALITATARDYYVDDRTRSVLRGDDKAATFQEFWTFQFFGGQWLLREIEQTRESDVLKDENFFEPFTDKGVDQVYGDAAGKAGPTGPWLDKDTETKATRIERLLNFLVQTDKLWDRLAMLERSRQIFLNVLLAREAGDAGKVSDAELFPAIAGDLRAEIARRQQDGARIEYRNLCVRKVELVHVNNQADNTQDEFTVRISAHAQWLIQKGGVEVGRDEDVTPFTQFWTFGRHEGKWKLKEVLPDGKGEELLSRENIDAGTSRDQLEWYYRQTRAN